MWGNGVWDWVIIAGAWAFSLGLWWLLGGFGTAGEAFASWGREAARKRTRRVLPQHAHLAEEAPRIMRRPRL